MFVFRTTFVFLARDQLWEPQLSDITQTWSCTGTCEYHLCISIYFYIHIVYRYKCLHTSIHQFSDPTQSSLLHRVVIVFIIIKIFFYVCWYRSRQRQLAAYLSNPRNAQIVIVGGRAYLHQMCERQSVSCALSVSSIWLTWATCKPLKWFPAFRMFIYCGGV